MKKFGAWRTMAERKRAGATIGSWSRRVHIAGSGIRKQGGRELKAFSFLRRFLTTDDTFFVESKHTGMRQKEN